ncbi:hypothetical protein Anas_10144 [Armadillidium nasatum]|uniref:Single domain-containing protein n=1 Tax=Armadillidium nasatum TaxID=96803 RepID=A0A5N5T612_9CRUS|nr:hypothetical protein Anas_10144 [Armadillidium nasatum]
MENFLNFIKILSFLGIISFCENATFRDVALIHPDDPNSCWLKSLNISLGVGEMVSLSQPKCTKILCFESNGILFEGHAMCGSIVIESENCNSIKVDYSKPYPKCCEILCRDIPNEKDPSSSILYDEFRNWVQEYYDYTPSEYV